MKNIKHIFTFIIIFTLSLEFTQAQDTAKTANDTAVHLKQVQILGVKKAQSVTTLTEDDLNRASGLNLQDALNTVPGVTMESRSPWGSQHIIIRGYYPSADNGRTNGVNFGGLGYQLYIDGIPVTDATGSTVMDDIDYSTLGSVEITKGPSPLYNSFIGGAVNLFTPAPTLGTSIQEQVVGGSYGLFRTNTSIMNSDGKTDIWVNYGHQTYQGFRENDGSQKDFANFTMNFHTSDKNTISTYAGYAHSLEDLGGEIDSAYLYSRNKDSINNAAYDQNFSHVSIESFRVGVTDKYMFNSHFSNQTTLYGDGHTLDQYFAHGFTLDNNQNFGGRTAFTYNCNGEKLSVNGILGATFEKSEQNSQGNFILPFVSYPFTPQSGPDFPSDQQSYAMNYNVFTQWTFKLPSQLALIVGGSMNYNEFGIQTLTSSGAASIYVANPYFIKSFSPVFTPNASLIKVFNNNVSVYGSVSMGYAPALVGDMINSAGRVDSTLKPEQAMQYEVGTKGNLLKNKLSYQLAIFDMDITNRLVQEYSNGIGQYTNAGEQRNLGAELYLGYNILDDKNAAISSLKLWATYTYSDFTYVDFKTYGYNKTSKSDTVTYNYDNNKVAEVAPNVFNLGVDVQSKIGFYLHATFQYVDKVPVTFDNAHYMNSYNLLGGRIGFKRTFGHVTLDVYGGVDNLLNSTYYTAIFVGQNIQELAQGSDPYVKGGGGDGYILPAPFNATFYGGITFKYTF
ncbi:MAG TPA: TonB-dependent receptor plug domain-containing protein [Bacteroidia bacterium]|jgi:iron complex outermembrane receptor protein|nr:TonB-dependent receptor plug domain-containing protein [Bacteroidia bacterium]